MWGGGYQLEVTEISLVQLGGVGGGYQLEVTEISLAQLGGVGGGYQSKVTEISLAQLGGVGRRLPVRGNRDISGPARRCGEEATSQR